MRVIRHSDARSFLDCAEAFLTEREARHNLPLAIARQCRMDPSRYPGPNYFAVVQDGAKLSGVALMTPPHRLQVFAPPGPAVDALVEDLSSGPIHPPGSHGPSDSTEAFAKAWCSRHGLKAQVKLNLRNFELTRVVPPPQPPGAMKRAELEDLHFVHGCYKAFGQETHSDPTSLPVEDIARRAVTEGRVFLWIDKEPVAQAGVMGSTPNGSRVGAVYTPHAHRTRGYATALVAALSQHMLDRGSRFCFLFTDLANPVSNSIYPKVGYRPVADYRDIDFVKS
ncbi:MAG: GNAT family N-acetyltransferase [Planctomycetes bacterium]|nr:GNAT family N-acetyltransferase [Planctomycetota bacterium]